MTLNARWQFEVDIHPEGWRFPAGKTWIAGWLWSSESQLVTDVRAWIDRQPHLALHGLPRPAIEQRFLGRPGPPYHGFSLLLEPPAEARLLRLKLRDQAGTWHEFFRTEIVAHEGAPPAPPPPRLATLLDHLVPALLRRQARRPRSPLASLADDAVAGALAEPLNSLPNPPFHGALEEPREAGWLRYGRLSITGWLAHRHQSIRRIAAMVEPLQDGTLLHGLKRTDIDDHFPDLPGRETAAFLGHVDLPADTSSPALLKVFAELADGEKHLVFAQRFTPHVITGADKPLPPLSRLTFARAVWALLGSARRHGLPRGSFAELRPALAAAWTAYSTEAPGKRRRGRLAEAERDFITRLERAAEAAPERPLSVLLVTHNLNFEGAPWFIFELARHLSGQPGARVRVVAPQDGPMRQVFSDAGIAVEVLDLSAAMKTKTPDEFHAALAAATAGLPWGETELVIANTMVSFWAVHAARRAGRPALLYVHESVAVRRFFEPLLAPALFPVVEAAFREAARVVFTAEASRAVYDHLGGRGNFLLLPSWVDVARIDAFAATHDPAALRRKHGFDPEAILVVNVGSVCERKGQHVFIQALALLEADLAAAHPEARIQFVMVGARPGLYLESLRQEIGLLGVAKAEFRPETGEIFDYYRLADVFVCTSFEESFPRVLLESAVFRLPIVSTNVNGIPEMLAADEAWLTPPGDRYRLAEAIKLALAAHFAGDRSRAEKARASVIAKYHETRSLPLHAALARTAAGTGEQIRLAAPRRAS